APKPLPGFLGEKNGNCTGHRRQPGIGKATALQLASEGYTVAVNFHHNIKAATEVINQIVDAGGKPLPVRADISNAGAGDGDVRQPRSRR
ncbi:hypothetical protein ACVXG7_01450, partial [Enterobacter hormaechei]